MGIFSYLKLKVYLPLEIELVDSLHIPISHAYYSGIGDITGDGVNEFVVGGYNDDLMNPNNQFWLYGAFASSGDDDYYLIDYLEISGVNSSNGMCIANVDDDIAEEIIITAAPYIYIFELQDEKFQAQWVGKSYRSYYPVATDFNNNNDGINEFAFNQYDDQDSLRLVIYSLDENLPTVSTPQNFHLHPLDGNAVKLMWNEQENINGFNIYRTSSFDPTDSTSLESSATSFIDTTVLKDSTYFYQISAYYENEESYPSLKKIAIPTHPPAVDSIKMISLNALSIDFTTPLDQSSTILANYQVGNIEYPVSAILSQGSSRVILTFANLFEEESSPYFIQIKNIKGYHHTPMNDEVKDFDFQEDVTLPFISNCIFEDMKKVKIIFNEYIQEESAGNPDNYELLFPEEYSDITISSILHHEEIVEIILSEKLEPTGESYFIKVFNIKDLAGNPILPGKNLVKISIPIKNLKSVLVGPNPVKPSCEKLYFQNLPTTGEAEVFIYNFAGNEIRRLSNSQLSKDYNTILWNMKNASNREIASGIYFYIIKYEGDYKKGKIAIIR